MFNNFQIIYLNNLKGINFFGNSVKKKAKHARGCLAFSTNFLKGYNEGIYGGNIHYTKNNNTFILGH